MFTNQLFYVMSIQLCHPSHHRENYEEMRKTLGITDDAFFNHVKKTFGSSNLSSYVVSLRKKPLPMEILQFRTKQVLYRAPGFILDGLTVVRRFNPIFFYLLDIIKDIIFLTILRNTLDQVKEENGELANSKVEQLLWYVAVDFVILTHILTGMLCFLRREEVFPLARMTPRSRGCYALLLLLLCPLLPIFFMMRLAFLQRRLQRTTTGYLRGEVSCEELVLMRQDMEGRCRPIVTCLASVRLIEGSFEAIPQLLVLSSFISFWKVYFYASRGELSGVIYL